MNRRKMFVVAGLAVIALLAGVLLLKQVWPGSRAVIADGPPGERIASICRIADQRLRGGDAVIAAAARKDGDASVRQAAATVLARYTTPASRQALEACLDDSDPGVRGAAARSLGIFNDDAAVARLDALARQDSQRPVQLMALEGLRLIPVASATVALTRLMESPGNPQVQQRAMEVLMIRQGIPASSRIFVPADSREWLSQVETIKNWPAVTSAFQQANQPLVHHADLILPPPKTH